MFLAIFIVFLVPAENQRLKRYFVLEFQPIFVLIDSSSIIFSEQIRKRILSEQELAPTDLYAFWLF